jgi:FAD/FMN-containing dehydrogenase
MPVVDPLGRLREIVGAAHVVTDPELMAPYAQDWTRRWIGKPLAVVRPGSTAEVAAVVRACADAELPLVPQGGNTGLVGGGVPQDGEVVLNLRRLNALGPVDPLARTVVVEAGATLAEVQRAARSAGLDVGLDFAARGSATIGGIAATNAGGELVLRHGVARDQIRGLEAVLADGSVVRRMSAAPRDNTGYDLVQLMIGSEGTLGVITAVQLTLVPPPGPTVAALVAVKTVDDALSVMGAVRQRFDRLDAAEYFHDDGLQLVLRHRSIASPFDRHHPLYLLVEVAGIEPEDLDELLEELDPVRDAVLAATAGDRHRLWELREAQTESIGAAGVPVKLDVALPLDRLGLFEQELPHVIREVSRHAVTILFGHLAEGNVHINLLAATQDDVQGTVTDAVLRLVAAHGGSISAEHGIGVAKRRWLPLTREAADIAAMRAIKRALDPGNLLAPGRILEPPA